MAGGVAAHRERCSEQQRCHKPWMSIEVKKSKSSSSVVYMKKIGTWAIWAYSVWVLIFLTPPFKFKAETEDLKH